MTDESSNELKSEKGLKYLTKTKFPWKLYCTE